MEDLIKRCKETHGQLSEIHKQMYEMAKELVKRYQEETGEDYIEFERDGRPLYSNNETGFLECYYRAKVVEDKLLMTKDDADEEHNEYNEDWRYCDGVDLAQVYECIINRVEIDYLFYLETIKDDLYWEYLDGKEGEDQ